MASEAPRADSRFTAWVAGWSRLTAPTRTLISAGTASSALIALASIWVGFLGTASPLWTIEWFRETRSSPTIVVAASIGLIVGCTGLVVCWLLLGRRVFRADRRLPAATLVIAAACWAVPLLLAMPLFDRDIFSYIAQGRLLANGFDPYRWGIDAVPGWQEVGVDSLWTSTLTPYGPVSLAIQRFVAVAVGPLGYHATILAYRLVAVAGIAAATWLVWRLAARSGRAHPGILWATVLNPMVLFTFAVGGHNDGVMIALMVGAFSAALSRRAKLAILLIALAVGVKSVAIIALPVIGLIHLGDDAPFLRKLRYWIGSGVACLAILGLVGAVQGLSLKWLVLASTPAIASSWFAPTSILAAALAGIGNLFGLTFDVTFVVGKAVAIVGAIGAGSYFLLTRRPLQPLHRLVLAFSAVIFFSPVIYPWYVAWPLFVATAASLTVARRGRLLVAATTIFFVFKGIIPPYGYWADALFGVVQGVLAAVALGVGAVLLWLELSSHRADTRRLPGALHEFIVGTPYPPRLLRRR